MYLSQSELFSIGKSGSSHQAPLHSLWGYRDLLLTPHSHQRQALYYMLKRERGWDLESQSDDVWKAVKDDLTGSTQWIPPP